MALKNLTAKDLKSLKEGQVTDLVNTIHSEISTVDGEKQLPKKYCKVWPILKAALTVAKIFTNDNVDKLIDGIIAAGDNTCSAK